MFRKSITYLFWLSVVASLVNSFSVKNDSIGGVLFILIPVLFVADLGLKFIWKQKGQETETGETEIAKKKSFLQKFLLNRDPTSKNGQYNTKEE